MDAMIAALKMLTRTPHLREYLQQHDPRALAQAEAALEPVGRRGGTDREALLDRLRARRAALAELEREVEELEGVLA